MVHAHEYLYGLYVCGAYTWVFAVLCCVVHTHEYFTCPGKHRGHSRLSGDFLFYHIITLRQWSFAESTICTRLTDQLALEFAWLCPWCWGYRHAQPCSSFYVITGDLNSDPYACRASTFPNKLSFEFLQANLKHAMWLRLTFLHLPSTGNTGIYYHARLWLILLTFSHTSFNLFLLSM